MCRTFLARDTQFQELCKCPGLKEEILIRLFPDEQRNKPSTGKLSWEGHPLVDPKEIARRQHAHCKNARPQGVLYHAPNEYGAGFPTYKKWEEMEPAKRVIEELEKRVREKRLRFRQDHGLEPWQSTPDWLGEDHHDYLAGAQRVFEPDHFHDVYRAWPNLHKNILSARNTRRKRWAAVMELFHRMNLYDLPPFPQKLGNLRVLHKAGARLVGVPAADKRIRYLRKYLVPLRLKPSLDRLYPVEKVVEDPMEADEWQTY